MEDNRDMSTLYQVWLDDQVLGFCAANLVGNAPPSCSFVPTQLADITNVLTAIWRDKIASSLSDTTLALLNKVSEEYDTPDHNLPEHMQPLADIRSQAKSEIELRKNGSGRDSSLLINHAVYVLKQSQLDIYKFFKWFKRNAGSNSADISRLLRNLSLEKSRNSIRLQVNQLLGDIRDPSEQTCDRVQAIDKLYELLSSIADNRSSHSRLLRVFLALRSSMYCWPLMIGGSNEEESHGISLPIGLFLSNDGKSKTDFKIALPRGATGRLSPPYVPSAGEMLAHMSDSKLCWDQDWENAVWWGAKVAKDLWRSQNGRLKYVDEKAARAKLTSNVDVDMGEACAIVDAVFGKIDVGSYTLKGRSAEAYWTQAVLGLMLPAGEIPLGVVTGCIEKTTGGAYELRHVEGIGKKLEYANNAGFSRVVLPGLETEYAESEETPVGAADSDVVGLIQDGGIAPGAAYAKAESVSDLDKQARKAEDSIQTKAKREVRSFRQGLATSGSSKRIEINYCPNARSAADAMQPSGWRRASFMRLPETQRAFSFCLRQLFLREQLRSRQSLSNEDTLSYRNHPWRQADNDEMDKLDRWLLSGTRSIKFVDRANLDRETREGGESSLGKWLAWKDHQVRTGAQDGYGMGGPGLGILCLRTTEADNDMRLWSTIADTLAATPEWLSSFQWAGRDQAAQLLAELLGNRNASPEISLTSAPDILVIFDEGNLTRRRTNPVFPKDFRGNWRDLLNTSKENRTAAHPLNKALFKLGKGAIGHTRIIVVFGQPEIKCDNLPDTISDDEMDILRRLAVYRFGFSKQAAYAIINHDKSDAQYIEWSVVDKKIKDFSKGIIRYSRGQYYIAEGFLEHLRQGAYWFSPAAHFSAALALAPIIDPNRVAISLNRDRSLEPESVIEAFWHLERARTLTPLRLKEERKRINNALNNLVFLMPFSDWDTVKRLQKTQSKDDAVDLGRELLDDEYKISRQPPHSSRVAALLNAIGEYGAGIAESARSELAAEATNRFENALNLMDRTSISDRGRQLCKLFSDYLYCMKKLNVSDDDYRLTGAKNYLQQTIEEILDENFFECIGENYYGLDDYPVSSDWLRCQWEDEELSLKDRARAAYVSARLSIGRRKDDKEVRAPWEGPWLDYFALTSPDSFDAAQLNSPLMTWDIVYGSNSGRTEAFAKWVLDSGSFRPPWGTTQQITPFGEKFGQAIENLWGFITNEDDQKRLRPTQSAVALKLVRAVALSETLPAFDFLRRLEPSWFVRLPTRINPNSMAEWDALARRVVESQAGWVLLLSSINSVNSDELEIVQSWLAGYARTGAAGLYTNDPENLLLRSPKNMELSKAYQLHRKKAVWNGYQLLGLRNERGWANPSGDRSQLEQIVDELIGDSYDWFIALCNHRPGKHLVAGVGLMLERRATAAVMEDLRISKGMEPFRKALIKRMPGWIALAGSWRGLFERFRNNLLLESCVRPPNFDRT
jgi:hypothetical protein